MVGSLNPILSLEQLASEKCASCIGANPIDVTEAQRFLSHLPGWTLRGGSIEKTFRFKSYLAGLDFVSKLALIAETENHHPDIMLGWRRVRVEFSTHSIGGLSRNDFIMAAKTELESAEVAS